MSTQHRSFHATGFSLVELLVVIAVIAVIAAIAIPNIANITQSASQATRLRNAQQLVSTYNGYAEAYFAANGSYPHDSPTAYYAIGLLGPGTIVTNARLGVTNFFAVPDIDPSNTETNKISSAGGQLVFTAGN